MGTLNFESMSDDEFRQIETPVATEEAQEISDDVTPENDDLDTLDSDRDDFEDVDTEIADEDEEEDTTDAVESSESSEQTNTTSDKVTEVEDISPDVEINYEEEYKRLLQPFKANGHEMQVNNVDEAVKLMQMGANYNKKMASLKPSLGVIKLLDKHDLLDQDKLSFLIDISNGDKGAINKLLKDRNIELNSFEDEDSDHSTYQRKTQSVSDNEITLENVFSEFKGDNNFTAVVQDISNNWDEASKTTIAEKPDLLRFLTNHKEIGVYETIMKEVNRQRALNNLNGESDLEAYRVIGTELERNGVFDTLLNKKNQTTSSVQPATSLDSHSNNSSNTVSVTDQINQRRKAASIGNTNRTPAKASRTKFDPTKMTDEEFEKAFDKHFQ